MIIEEIKLHCFRNYSALTLRPHAGTNVLFGPNGSGKTNLLEAVHYCALGRSHRTSLDREVVRRDAPAGACGVRVRRREGTVDIAVKLTPEETRKKQVFLQQKKAARLSDLMGKLQCVIFSPEDLLLVKEGPALRRRYLDMMISQMNPGYFAALQKYQRALEQRNALLRENRRGNRADPLLLDAYEEELARQSAVLLPARHTVILRLQELAAQAYQSISGQPGEPFQVGYVACTGQEEDIPGYVRRQLQLRRQDDTVRGGTGFGPHREDLSLTLDGREMRLYASQGQMRTAALALKLSQLTLFSQETGEKPVLLLDDVMSELDLTRRTRLLQEIDGIQTFVTCTDESDLMGCRDFRSWHVEAEPDGAVIRSASPEPAPAEVEEPVFD